VKQREFMLAAMQYATSDRPIGEVVKLLSTQEKAESALTFYLDRVLFDLNVVHLLDEEDVALADQILMHYHLHSPARLASVVLDSSLSSYTQSLALRLLELREGKEAKDLFARSLLYLDQGRVDDAISVFKTIHSSSLVQFCIANPKLLAPEHMEPETEGTYPLARATTMRDVRLCSLFLLLLFFLPFFSVFLFFPFFPFFPFF
jgi:hypothetical protein